MREPDLRSNKYRTESRYELLQNLVPVEGYLSLKNKFCGLKLYIPCLVSVQTLLFTVACLIVANIDQQPWCFYMADFYMANYRGKNRNTIVSDDLIH